MVKLLICLISATVLGMFLLELRHQELELGHQTAELHDQIKARQAKLWNQQRQIAELTAPNAIDKTIKGNQIDMVPEFPTQRANWIEDQAAE